MRRPVETATDGLPELPADVYEALVSIWAEILYEDYLKRHGADDCAIIPARTLADQ